MPLDLLYTFYIQKTKRERNRQFSTKYYNISLGPKGQIEPVTGHKNLRAKLDVTLKASSGYMFLND